MKDFIPMYATEVYKRVSRKNYRVLVVRATSPDQFLKNGKDSIHEILKVEKLDRSIGLYFYRFQNLSNVQAFTKIGEVSREDGIIIRKHRGWLGPLSNSDSYRTTNKQGRDKGILTDVQATSLNTPMLFVFYEFDIENSFPKIDEITAFAKHLAHFGCKTINKERTNTFSALGSKLLWHPNAFEEVLRLEFPSGARYPWVD